MLLCNQLKYTWAFRNIGCATYSTLTMLIKTFYMQCTHSLVYASKKKNTLWALKGCFLFREHSSSINNRAQVCMNCGIFHYVAPSFSEEFGLGLRSQRRCDRS